jgi:transglutaminase-like putative cysteine protease
MLYTIRHVTRFTYEAAIAESVMEARMQPRSELTQRCIHFGLSTTPSSRVMMYQDHDGNIVHHFNIPGRHSRLTMTAEALVELSDGAHVPESLDPGAWDRLDEMTATGEYWDVMNPSVFARSTALLNELASELALTRTDDPLSALRHLTEEIFRRFEYRPESTRVDSPIDDALEARRGVCQDFAHIFITLARELGIPCRYISGYLFRRSEADDRSLDGATHAWAEALLPDVGWIGFDPTNNMVAGDGHIRVAVGRDYADVPPTRGVYKGVSAVRSELAVAVKVGTAQPAVIPDATPFVPWMSRDAAAPFADSEASQQQQQ